MTKSLAFAAPISPAKIEAWKGLVGEILGPRHGEHESSRRRLGITRETVWLQHSPAGELLIFYIEADDPERVLQGMTESTEPFDLWLKQQLEHIPGLFLETARAGFANEKYIDWRAA